MQAITVKDRQTVLDIAMQHAGTVEACIAVAEANGLSITDEMVTGQLLKSTDIVFSEVVKTFYKENRSPANGSLTSGIEENSLGGIGNWSIGRDFVVS